MSSDDLGPMPPGGLPRAARGRRVLGRGPGAGPPPARDDARPAGSVGAGAAEDGDRDPKTSPGPDPLPDAPKEAAGTAAEPDEAPPHSVEPSGELLAEPAAEVDATEIEAEAADDPVPEPPPAPVPVPEAAPVPLPEAKAEAAPEAEAETDDRIFKVRLVNFEGPFDLLLQLISKHKLDVTEVALSKVTDEFMAHIKAMGPDWDLDQTTEFLVVAATLLDLKAARLLPAAEVEDEADLALLEARDLLFARLLQYRAYKRIADIFSGRLDAEARRHPRTVGLEPHHAELLPEVVISIGAEGFARLAVKAMQPRPEPQVYVDHIHAPLVSVVEQAEVLVERLRKEGEASFRELVADAADTLTVVARFLALLELYREKAVALDQDDALGELTVRWTGGDADAAPTVTDEFDRAPQAAQDEAAQDEAEEAEDTP